MNLPTPASNPVVTVRRARVEDRARLLSFYAEHHAQRSRLTGGAIWDWLYLKQPDMSGELPLYILEANGNIAGGIGYIGAQVQVDRQRIPAILPISYFINPAFRGLPALRLLRIALKDRALAIGAYVSPDARRLLLKMGFVDLSAAMRSYHYGLRGQTGLRSVAILAIRRTAELLRRSTRTVMHPGLRHRVGPDLDREFVEQCHPVASLHRIQKSFSSLEWRYGKSPLLNSSSFRVEFVYQFRSSRPVALAIIAVNARRSELILLDVIWSGGAVLSAVVDRVIAYGRAAGCGVISTHALSAPLHQTLTACLFASTVSSIGMMVLARDPAVRTAVSDPARWHFMVGDCDAY
ncbi:MAG: hypothetical protein L0H63_04105 [Nitrococcus sp.]|nr:hypothetical protein [Nitrococcus sp.]